MAIRVLNRFPEANVRVLKVHAEGSNPEIEFTPDPRGGNEALWFYFRVEDKNIANPPPESLTLTLRFFENLLGSTDSTNMRPVIRAAGKNWFRLKTPDIERLPDGREVLSWTIPYPTETTEVAFCFPYYRDELSVLLGNCKGYWTEEEIGLTQSGRILTRLRNSVLQGGASCPNPRGLYIVARQHSGETPGSWVLDGLLYAFARAKPVNWAVWAVPFANLDGVAEGDYGKDPYPHDLNRAWGAPPMRHETLVMQRDMRRWKKLCKPDLVLDLHAPGGCEAVGVYGFYRETQESEWGNATQAWLNVLRQGLGPEYAADEFMREGKYASRWEKPRLVDFARDDLQCPAATLEFPYGLCRDLLLTPKQYREIGQRLARAIMQRWSK
jgi:hypothetical protein